MKDERGDFEDQEEDDLEVGSFESPTPYYYRQDQETSSQAGCLAVARNGCLHFIVTHVALYLILGFVVLGGSFLVKGLIRLGWHGAITILLGGLMILSYVFVVIAITLIVSHAGKRITGDKDF